MQVNVFVGSSKERTYTVVDESGQDLDLINAGIVKIEFCVQGRVLSSDTDSVSYTGNEITVTFGDLNLNTRVRVPVIVRFYTDNNKFEAIGLTQNGAPVTLNFRNC